MTSTEVVAIPRSDLLLTIEELRALCECQSRELAELRDEHSIDQALIAQLSGEAENDRESIRNLEDALETSRRIGAAIGIVMATCKIDEDSAFYRLRRASQNGHRKLRVLAEDVIYTGMAPNEWGAFPDF